MTTQIYTQVSIRKLKEIHALTHPAKLEKQATATPPTNGASAPNGEPVNGATTTTGNNNQMLLGFAEQAREQEADALLSLLAAEPDNDSDADNE